jgi:hypothetical protein
MTNAWGMVTRRPRRRSGAGRRSPSQLGWGGTRDSIRAAAPKITARPHRTLGSSSRQDRRHVNRYRAWPSPGGAAPHRRELQRLCNLGRVMTGRLAGKVCLVTGTGGSIGRATALTFAREGATVVGCDTGIEAAEQTVALVHGAGGSMVSLQPCLLDDPAECAKLVDLALREFGRLHPSQLDLPGPDRKRSDAGAARRRRRLGTSDGRQNALGATRSTRGGRERRPIPVLR